MAEAIVNTRLGADWQAYSAGTNPIGCVHPKALSVLEEIGISHVGFSKQIADLKTKEFHVVITVCDDAAKNCPVWLGEGKRHHIGFPDPAKAEGTEEEIMAVFRYVRDEIDVHLVGYLKDLE